MTSREYLSKLVRLYCLERYGRESIEVDCYDDTSGETIVWDGLEGLVADFEIWRASYEIKRQEENSSCLI